MKSHLHLSRVSKRFMAVAGVAITRLSFMTYSLFMAGGKRSLRLASLILQVESRAKRDKLTV